MPDRAKTWRLWTPAEDDRLESLRLEGLTAVRIARLLGRTPVSIRRRSAQLDLPLFLARRAAYLAEFAPRPGQARRPNREIARTLGVTVHAVKAMKGRLRRIGAWE